MARLDKKNDDRLSAYFKEFIAMCKRVCGRATEEEIVQGICVRFPLIHSPRLTWVLTLDT